MSRTCRQFLILILTAAVAAPFALAQPDPLTSANQSLRDATHDSFGFTFEERTRWEERDGVNFGKAVNQQDMLSRLRIGAQYHPFDWITFSAMGQDARAPFFGVPAPNNLRDSMDLEEAYVQLGRGTKGPGAIFGRQMTDFGESRLIGSPQWSNVSRAFDVGRVYYRTAKARYEFLMVSPGKVLPDAFNHPDLGERIWGMYDTFTSVVRRASFDAYALRHSQNKIGGWSAAGTLGTDSFGGRVYGPLPAKWTYSFEGVDQAGHVGLSREHAFAWYAGITHKGMVKNHPFTILGEFEGASGTNRGSANVGTFDQVAAANHDKFGHQDLFGWRNLKTLRNQETLSLTKALAWNVMYTNEWLYSASDALYNSGGSSIAISKAGTAGTHVGQELDTFLTVRRKAHLFGAGFGHFFRGEFVENTTPHINPRYFYVFQQYAFK